MTAGVSTGLPLASFHTIGSGSRVSACASTWSMHETGTISSPPFTLDLGWFAGVTAIPKTKAAYCRQQAERIHALARQCSDRGIRDQIEAVAKCWADKAATRDVAARIVGPEAAAPGVNTPRPIAP